MNPPKSDQDIVNLEPLIRKLAYQQGVPSHELDDFVGDVYLEWIQGKYLEKYDPAKAAFTTYFYAFVNQRSKRNRDRHLRRAQGLIDSDVGDETEQDDDNNWTIALADPIDVFGDREEDSRLREILSSLKDNCPVIEIVTMPIQQGNRIYTVQFERSLYTLALLLLWGYEERDIAKIFHRSQGTVGNMIADLRSRPEITQAVLHIHPTPKTMMAMAAKNLARPRRGQDK